MTIGELIPQLVALVNNGEDLANEDAAALFRWLDKNSREWREMRKQATADDFLIAIHAKAGTFGKGPS
jgi:hypothetical protein